MNTIMAEVQDQALVLPSEILETLGWRQSDKISIEKDNGKIFLRLQEMSAEEIERRAGIYLAKYVGEATDVKPPIRFNGKWRVEAVLSYRPETIGYLTYTPQGELIEEESDSPAKLRGLKREN